MFSSLSSELGAPGLGFQEGLGFRVSGFRVSGFQGFGLQGCRV